LVLNADGQPLSIMPLSRMSWQDSVTAYYQNKVDIIEFYDDVNLRSPSTTLKLPSVVMLREYVKPKISARYCRYNIYLRDDFVCQYCGFDGRETIEQLSIDHVLPRALGGKSVWNNVVTACHSCNGKKAHFTTMKPKTLPKKPSHWELINKRKNYVITIPDMRWNLYLQWDESKIKYVAPKLG